MRYEDKGIRAICLILSLALAMAAGALAFGRSIGAVPAPRAQVFGVDRSEMTRRLFVSGAVQREGFYEVTADMTYRELFVLTGLYTVSDISRYDYDKYVNITLDKIIPGYYQDGALCPSTDINSASEGELAFLGLEEDEARALIEGRPYGGREELLSRGILTREKFMSIEHKIFAGQGE